MRLRDTERDTCAGFSFSASVSFPCLWNQTSATRLDCVGVFWGSGADPSVRPGNIVALGELTIWTRASRMASGCAARTRRTVDARAGMNVIWMNPQRHGWTFISSQRSKAAPPPFAPEADKDQILLRKERGKSTPAWILNGFYTEAQQEVESRQLLYFCWCLIFFFFFCPCREDKSIKCNNLTSAYRQPRTFEKRAHFAVNLV